MMTKSNPIGSICWQLGVGDPRYIEIEAKKRVLPDEAKALRKHLLNRKGVKHVKRVIFYDQFLDTPNFALLQMGASMRLRYKGGGSEVFLQYKGPGFHRSGLLYRSEFSSDRLDHVVREESHHDMVQFGETSVREILHGHVEPAMAEAIRRHLGNRVIDSIVRGPILVSYQKDKYRVDLDSGYLEPSVDHLLAFHINPDGLHTASSFWEYENEIKTDDEDFESKIEHIPALLDFDRSLAKKFDLKVERLDKYHRCASCFLALPKRGEAHKPAIDRSLMQALAGAGHAD